MTDKSHVRAVFNEALERTGAERQAFLDGACHGDVELRVRVERLLAAAEKDDPFLSSPTAQQAPSSMPADGSAPIVEGPGTWIGPYKLLQQIGQGGFGVVFMAEQQSPVVRRVALKIIKLGMDTRALIARFEQERQALALMDHPNIAKVLDAGATQTGRPYFVMELVRGEPITDYCDKNNLSTQDRLELFVTVCHAVQHAHQKGIIHRDIKPSNVLVTVADGRPIPKVIDFGIAKATLGRLTEKTVFTEHKMLIGTPEYMSPEQAEMSAVDIDTRSDIYSLGVLLYELLTGTTPFDGQALRGAAFGELQRIIREVEPPKPSTRISTMKGTLPKVAANRHVEPRKLGALIRGDLDWIVMRCLEKDRVRRYDTANGLASDVQRHLAGEAVLAAPPSAAYRARKFVKRNKGTVIAAMLVALALVLGLAGTAVAYFNMLHQKTQAETARTEEQNQRTLAEKARARAESINRFVQTALTSSDPNQGGKQSMLVADAMMQAVTELDAGTFVDDPETEADLRTTIAAILLGNGRAHAALPQAEKAFAIRQRLHPHDHTRVVDNLMVLGEVLAEVGDRGPEAEAMLRRALDMLRRLHTGDHPAVAVGLSRVAWIVLPRDGAEAESLSRESFAMTERLYQGDHDDVTAGLNNLASVYMTIGRPGEAEPLLARSLEMVQRLIQGDHPKVATILSNLATVRAALGRMEAAEELHRSALEMTRRMFQSDHQDVARCLHNAAMFKQSIGKMHEAEPILTESLEMRRRLYPGDHPEVATTLNNLGFVRLSLGRAAEAEKLVAQSLEMQKRLGRGEGPLVPAVLVNLGNARAALGRLDEAATSLETAIAMFDRLGVGDSSDKAMALTSLARVRQSQQRYAEAEELFKKSLAMEERLHGAEHANVAAALIGLVEALQGLGRVTDAEPLSERALEIHRKTSTDDHVSVAVALLTLGNAREMSGRIAEAEPIYAQALEMYRRLKVGDHKDVVVALYKVAYMRQQLGRAAESEPLYVEAVAMARRLPSGETPDLVSNLENLAEVRQNLGRPTEAEPLFVEALEMQKRLFPGDHPDTIRILGKLAYVRGHVLGGPADGEPLLVEALEMSRRLFDGDHPSFALVLNNLGRCRALLGRAKEAEPLLRESFEMHRRLLKGDDPNVANVMTNLARCLADVGKLDEALPMAEKAAEIAASTVVDGHPLRVKCDKHLAEIEALKDG